MPPQQACGSRSRVCATPARQVPAATIASMKASVETAIRFPRNERIGRSIVAPNGAACQTKDHSAGSDPEANERGVTATESTTVVGVPFVRHALTRWNHSSKSVAFGSDLLTMGQMVAFLEALSTIRLNALFCQEF